MDTFLNGHLNEILKVDATDSLRFLDPGQIPHVALSDNVVEFRLLVFLLLVQMRQEKVSFGDILTVCHDPNSMPELALHMAGFKLKAREMQDANQLPPHYRFSMLREIVDDAANHYYALVSEEDREQLDAEAQAYSKYPVAHLTMFLYETLGVPPVLKANDVRPPVLA